MSYAILIYIANTFFVPVYSWTCCTINFESIVLLLHEYNNTFNWHIIGYLFCVFFFCCCYCTYFLFFQLAEKNVCIYKFCCDTIDKTKALRRLGLQFATRLHINLYDLVQWAISLGLQHDYKMLLYVRRYRFKVALMYNKNQLEINFSRFFSGIFGLY